MMGIKVRSSVGQFCGRTADKVVELNWDPHAKTPKNLKLGGEKLRGRSAPTYVANLI